MAGVGRSNTGRVRLLSVVAGVLFVPAIYLLGQQLYDDATGVLAAAFLTISRFQISHAQQVRMYSLVVLLTIASYYGYWYVRNDGTRMSTYLSATGALVATHPFGVLAVASQFVSGGVDLIGRRRSRRRRSQSIATSAVVGAVAAAGLSLMIPGRRNPWLAPPGIRDIAGALLSFFPNGGPFVRPLAPVLIVGVLAVFVRIIKGSGLPVRVEFGEADRLLIAGAVVPVGLLVTASYLVTPVFKPRYAVVAAPPLYLLVGRGLSRVERQHLRVALIVVLLAGMSASVVGYHDGGQREQWAEATAKIETEADTDAVVLVADQITVRNVRYYLNRDLRVVGVVVSDSGTGRAPTQNTTIRRAVAGYDEVWAVYSHVDRSQERRLSSVVATTYEPAECAAFVGVRVCRFDPRNSAAARTGHRQSAARAQGEPPSELLPSVS